MILIIQNIKVFSFSILKEISKFEYYSIFLNSTLQYYYYSPFMGLNTMPLHIIIKSVTFIMLIFKQTLYVIYIYNSLYEVSYYSYSNFLDEKIEEQDSFETYPNLQLVRIQSQDLFTGRLSPQHMPLTSMLYYVLFFTEFQRIICQQFETHHLLLVTYFPLILTWLFVLEKSICVFYLT